MKKFKKKNKENQFSMNSMMMDENFKNNWSQLDPTFTIYNTDYKVGSQHKRQTQKNNNVKF
jgi:hypothetical protein